MLLHIFYSVIHIEQNPCDATVMAARELNRREVVKAVTTCHLACIGGMTHGTNQRLILKVRYFDGSHCKWVPFYMNHPVDIECKSL
jgi:hypothetical protein